MLLVLLIASPVYAVDPLPLTPTPMDPTEAANRMTEVAGESAQRVTDGVMQAHAGISLGASWASLGIDVQGAASELLDSWRALTNVDATCMDLGDAGAPSVPTSCADTEQCGQCFTDAQRKLDGMRINLERLRCVYTAAADFTRASIAFGDTTSGIHAVTGLAWQAEKRGIEEAFASLKNTYDTKYGQMLPNLRGALEAIGECEARFFNNRDWYNRFGFIYYTFMSDRYKRSD
ncbi:MAG TPA: hypothetical protein VIV11_04420 [Kofleriaceae bacterium]